MPITKWCNLAINQTKAANVVLFNVKFSLHPSHFLVFRYDGRRTQGGIRMDKIAFLVADELMQQSVATITQTYNEKLTQHSFRIKIEIIDFPRLIDTIPILCLFSSTNDALYTLRSIAPKYKKIHLLLNENFMFNKDACPEELRKKNRLPIYSIRPSESTMLSVLLYVQELLVFQKKDSQQLSMMSSILSHVTDGIILYAKGGAIYHINKRAASFLGIPETTQNMRDIFPNWKEGKKPSFQETILHRPPYTLVANSDYFLTDSAAQYIMTIRDVTELQRLEKNIRYKLSKTGMTAAHHFEDKYPAPEPAISERPA